MYYSLYFNATFNLSLFDFLKRSFSLKCFHPYHTDSPALSNAAFKDVRRYFIILDIVRFHSFLSRLFIKQHFGSSRGNRCRAPHRLRSPQVWNQVKTGISAVFIIVSGDFKRAIMWLETANEDACVWWPDVWSWTNWVCRVWLVFCPTSGGRPVLYLTHHTTFSSASYSCSGCQVLLNTAKSQTF